MRRTENLTEDQLYELLLSEEDCLTDCRTPRGPADESGQTRRGAYDIEVGTPGQTARDIVRQLCQLEQSQPGRVSVHVSERCARPDREKRHQDMAGRVAGVIRLICPGCTLIEDRAS